MGDLWALKGLIEEGIFSLCTYTDINRCIFMAFVAFLLLVFFHYGGFFATNIHYVVFVC